jgi:short-subunit dehydrogenase
MGLTGAAGAVDYISSKYAVTGYIESLRQELLDTYNSIKVVIFTYLAYFQA